MRHDETRTQDASQLEAEKNGGGKKRMERKQRGVKRNERFAIFSC